MPPEPDHGEEIYKGSGKLPGQTTLITGGDSGIGRVVAIAFAREGTDIAISYLTEEQADLGAVKGWIEKAGRWALLLPGDPEDPAPWVRDPWLFAGRRPTSTGGYARTGL